MDRPALAAVVPNRKGRTVLLDVGANAQCKARHLEEFAIMGSAYARGVLHVDSPRVGLMSVGEEESKGNDLVREAHEALKASRLNFVGNVEGHDIFAGDVDVVVMDGFTGNVVLKTCETLAEFIIELVREEVEKDARGRLGEWLLMPALRTARRRSDPAEVGGAPLLGVRGCCVIGHGQLAPAGRPQRDPRRGRVPHERRQRRDRRRGASPRRLAGGSGGMSVAFVFPGQGSQEAGMGRALADAFPESRAVFDEADAALGFPISRLCFEGPDEELKLTANTQPAILATSVAALRPLGRRAASGRRSWPATASASTRRSWPRAR